MAGLLYFLPEHTGPTLDMAAWGLEHAFAAPPTLVESSAMLAGEKYAGSVAYDEPGAFDRPANLTGLAWHAAPGRRWWVALPVGEPLTPERFLRPQALAGEVVTIDGVAWIAPRLRLHLGPEGFTTCLDHRLTLDPGGQWATGGVDPRHARLDAIATRLMEGMIQAHLAGPGSPAPLTLAEGAQLAAELLAFNYRVGVTEIGALELLSGQSTVAVCRSACDYDTAEAFAQGKQAASAA